jgi:hypothetical protein
MEGVLVDAFTLWAISGHAHPVEAAWHINEIQFLSTSESSCPGRDLNLGLLLLKIVPWPLDQLVDR